MARSRGPSRPNQVDVHRATDAVLTCLDALANDNRNVLIVATTNDERSVEGAFLSRVDLYETFGLPSREVLARILVGTLARGGGGHTRRTPKSVARACSARGVDARRVRKLVLEALVSNGI